jgi:hypothetical protein
MEKETLSTTKTNCPIQVAEMSREERLRWHKRKKTANLWAKKKLLQGMLSKQHLLPLQYRVEREGGGRRQQHQ